MTDEIDEQKADLDQSADSSQAKEIGVKPAKAKLVKVLPTERVSFEKQMAVLRAYAAASGPAKKAVTNEEVSQVVSGLAASSISLCNPYFSDTGLLAAEGRKQRPVDAVFDYLHGYEWSPETAALKLKDIFAGTWAAATLLPKLSFRQLTRDEAVQFLADESKAQKSHRKNLEIILEFLSATGVVKIEGNTVSKVQSHPGQLNNPPSEQTPPPPPAQNAAKAGQSVAVNEKDDGDVERFTIPIPGKEAAVITVPRDLDADDWDMLSMMIATYIKRLRKDSIKGSGPS